MKEKLVVKKWGGENAAELVQSPQNVVDDFISGIKQVVVVSAIRSPDYNTTDNLIELSLSLKENNKENIYLKINEIKKSLINIVEEKLGENSELIKEIEEFFEINLTQKINIYLLQNNKIEINKKNDYSINNGDKIFSLIGFGEELSAFVQSKLINNLGVDGLSSEVVDIKGITNGLESDFSKNENFNKLSIIIKDRISSVLDNNKIPIVSGYIPGFKGGIENAIGRGYTDANSAMVSVGFSNSYDTTLEIQKSVDGILSIDPRILENGEVKLIEKMDYLTAKEITGVRGSQAKLLHSQVLRKELLQAGVNVKLFNPFTNSKGTLISKEKNTDSEGVEYIGARNNVIFFSISSWDMSAPGILASIFKTVEKYNISVDIVSTSETEISFTIDDNLSYDKLESLSNDIRNVINIKEEDNINFVKYRKNKALLFCIGQNLKHKIGSLLKATNILQKANINSEMVSQGSMERSIIFGIDEKDMNIAANLLHKEFIEE